MIAARFRLSLPLALCGLLALLPTIEGHSWVEQMQQINDDGSFVGSMGYPRGYTARTDPGFNDKSMTYLIPALDSGRTRISAVDLLCHPNQRKQSQAPNYPMLSLKAGGYIAMKYLENGHVSIPSAQKGKPQGGGTVFVFGTAQPKEDEKITDVLHWTKDGKGGDGRGSLLAAQNYDDGRCHQINPQQISQQRQQEYPDRIPGQPTSNVEQWCETDVKLPANATGLLTLYWVWQWPTAPGTDPTYPDGKDEYYTTCSDVNLDGADMAQANAQAVQPRTLVQQDPQPAAPSNYLSRTALMINPLMGFAVSSTLLTSTVSKTSGIVTPTSADIVQHYITVTETAMTKEKEYVTLVETRTVTDTVTTILPPATTPADTAPTVPPAPDTTSPYSTSDALSSTSPSSQSVTTLEPTTQASLSNATAPFSFAPTTSSTVDLGTMGTGSVTTPTTNVGMASYTTSTVRTLPLSSTGSEHSMTTNPSSEPSLATSSVTSGDNSPPDGTYYPSVSSSPTTNTVALASSTTMTTTTFLMATVTYSMTTTSSTSMTTATTTTSQSHTTSSTPPPDTAAQDTLPAADQPVAPSSSTASHTSDTVSAVSSQAPTPFLQKASTTSSNATPFLQKASTTEVRLPQLVYFSSTASPEQFVWTKTLMLPHILLAAPSSNGFGEAKSLTTISAAAIASSTPTTTQSSDVMTYHATTSSYFSPPSTAAKLLSSNTATSVLSTTKPQKSDEKTTLPAVTSKSLSTTSLRTSSVSADKSTASMSTLTTDSSHHPNTTSTTATATLSPSVRDYSTSPASHNRSTTSEYQISSTSTLSSTTVSSSQLSSTASTSTFASESTRATTSLSVKTESTTSPSMTAKSIVPPSPSNYLPVTNGTDKDTSLGAGQGLQGRSAKFRFGGPRRALALARLR